MTALAANGEPRRRKGVIGAVLVLIGLPVVLALAEAVSFYATNRSNGTIVSSGLEREYLLYVPASYDRTRPTPLVITMHGGAMWPAAQLELDRWNRVAEEHGFIGVLLALFLYFVLLMRLVRMAATAPDAPGYYLIGGSEEHTS